MFKKTIDKYICNGEVYTYIRYSIFRNKKIWIQFQKLRIPKCVEFSLWIKASNSNFLYVLKKQLRIPLNIKAFKDIIQIKKLYKEDL